MTAGQAPGIAGLKARLKERLREWWRPLHGRLEEIWTAPAAGRPMQPRDAVQLTAGGGLEGDRYATGQGHWHAVEACDVTLITADELRRATRRAVRSRERDLIAPGEHRRNLVVSGLRHSPREGLLHIGDTTLEVERPRPPCGWLNQVTGYNLAGALRRDSGICLKVRRGGTIRPGDPVLWEPASQDAEARR